MPSNPFILRGNMIFQLPHPSACPSTFCPEAFGELSLQESDEPIRRAIGIKAAVLVTNLTIFCPENQDGMNRAGVIQALVAMLSKIQASGHAGGSFKPLSRKLLNAQSRHAISVDGSQQRLFHFLC